MKTITCCGKLRCWALLGLLCTMGGLQATAQVPDWDVLSVCRTGGNGMAFDSNRYDINVLAADTSGHVYLAGNFLGTVAFGSIRLTSTGSNDLFVACWNKARQAYDWATPVHSAGDLSAIALTLGNGSLYITGDMISARPYTTPAHVAFGPDTLTALLGNSYVAKLDLAGRFVWARQTQGNAEDFAVCLAVSGSSVYVGGSMLGDSLRFGGVAAPPTGYSNRDSDGYVAKLTDQGSSAHVDWVRLMGDRGRDEVGGLAAVGNLVYVVGGFASDSIHWGSTTLVNSTLYRDKVFVGKLLDLGSTCRYGWAVGSNGPGYDGCRGIIATGTALYLAGDFAGTFSLLGTTVVGGGIHPNLYMAQLTDAGSSPRLGWMQQAGGTGFQVVDAMAACGSTLYVGGHFGSAATTFGSTTLATVPCNPANPISTDGYVTRLTDTGLSGTFDWAGGIGGPGYDTVNRMTVGGSDLYIAGQVDAPATFGMHTLAAPVPLQANYLATLAAAPLPRPPRLMAFAPTAGPAGTVIALTGTNFTAASGVSFDGIAAPGFVVNAAGTQITVAVPAGASSGLLRVSTPGGTAVSSTAFTVQTALNTARSQATALALRPNPARGTATLHLPTPATEPLPLRIVDALGRTLRTQALPARATETTLDLTGLAPGLYLVRVGMATGRLVVE